MKWEDGIRPDNEHDDIEWLTIYHMSETAALSRH